MDMALKCLTPKEFEKLKGVISKHTHLYEKRDDSWIKSILGRLDGCAIKECKQDDLKRIILIIDMWNSSGLKKPDADDEKIIIKLKKFYVDIYHESIFKFK